MSQLVSVVTGCIPSRLGLLRDAIDNLAEQSYRDLEHCIAIEGEPAEVDAAIETVRGWQSRTHVPLRLAGLGRWWSREVSDSYAAAPFLTAQLLARGRYACFWADDERALTPDHVAKLVALIEQTRTTFVYPTVDFYWHDRPSEHLYIGADPPRLGSITHWLYRNPEMIERARGPYRTHVGRANDWEFIQRAMRGGATWAWLPEVTFSHRADD